MKHFIDIEHLREEDVHIGEAVKLCNSRGFRVGDTISITEKVDGANASITFEDGEVKAFSHRNELSPLNTLRGFYEYTKHLDDKSFRENPDYVVFAEWLVKHTVVYNREAYKKMYVYSIFDKVKEEWLDAVAVKEFCKQYDLEYVHELYFGPFVSWEHCRSFLNSPAYGERQEGVVVRNLSNQNGCRDKEAFIVKIVNDSFRETQKSNHVKKVLDPQKIEDRKKAEELIATIVTEARVRKMINKLVDEGILPSEWTPKVMGIVAKELPKRIYEDCMKEEIETVYAAGEFASKCISSRTMDIARSIIL